MIAIWVVCIVFPVPLTEITNYVVSDNGEIYTDFMGCDFDSSFAYSYFTLIQVAPVGPYQVDSWSVNGTTYSGLVQDVDALVDSMNVWDPTGNWTHEQASLIIMGGDLNNAYGPMVIRQVTTNAQATLKINTNEIPNGTKLTFDPGFHVVVFTDSLGCSDTLFVSVECNDCPEIFDGPLTIEAENCDGLTEVCLGLPADSISLYEVDVDGMIVPNANTTFCWLRQRYVHQLYLLHLPRSRSSRALQLRFVLCEWCRLYDRYVLYH